jgi:hypothetical protein
MVIRRKFTKKYREQARNMVDFKIDYFNKFYKFQINRIAIKNTKTRWGSCSSKGNLNFNYKIIFLKKELADYLIVHELCHLGELNHSKKFWNLVKKTLPNYIELNKELRKTPANKV